MYIRCELEAVAVQTVTAIPLLGTYLRSVLVYCIHRQNLEDTSYTTWSERPFKEGTHHRNTDRDYVPQSETSAQLSLPNAPRRAPIRSLIPTPRKVRTLLHLCHK